MELTSNCFTGLGGRYASLQVSRYVPRVGNRVGTALCMMLNRESHSYTMHFVVFSNYQLTQQPSQVYYCRIPPDGSSHFCPYPQTSPVTDAVIGHPAPALLGLPNHGPAEFSNNMSAQAQSVTPHLVGPHKFQASVLHTPLLFPD